MKKVILFLWLLPAGLLCQVSENFETGLINNWTQSNENRWAADNASPLRGQYSLHHAFDNPGAGSDQAGIHLSDIQPSMGPTDWSFIVRHGYEPSSSNNWAFFLMADNNPVEMHPGGNINGFAIGVNFDGYDDTLRLWKVINGDLLSIASVNVDWQSDIGISSPSLISVSRSPDGLWNITLSDDKGNFRGEGSGFDPELFDVTWLGVYYKYTSTRDRLLWLDDISVNGIFIADTTAPSVNKITLHDKNSADIILNEEPGQEFSALSNFSLNGDDRNASAILKINPGTYRVTFPGEFINKSLNRITIKKICDNHLNCRKNHEADFIPFWAEPGDVIITEIMADPSPPVSLPAAEYIEILNRTISVIDLENWKIISEGQTAVLPRFLLNPSEYMILCTASSVSLFSASGRVTGVKNFPLLTDAGKSIILADSTGNMIHGVEYSDSWYGDILKSDGGWSLEMIDIQYPFNPDENWKASISKTGGSPGSVNSVRGSRADRSFRGIMNVFPEDDRKVIVTFSEPVKNLNRLTTGIMAGGKPVTAVSSNDLMNRTFSFETGFKMENKTVYGLSLPDGITDFSGNLIEKRTDIFGLPEICGNKDIVFNELLFNPLPGFPDFIELVNNSDKIIDAFTLLLTSVNDLTGDTSTLVPVSDVHRSIFPGDIYAITTGREALINRYFSGIDSNIYEVDQLPSMPDDNGHLLLFNRRLDLIDEVVYNDGMHFSLLSGTEGISLEKPDPGSTSGWHSASETSGWATPGAVNSIFSESPQEDIVTLSSTRITPDNDGYEDLLTIDFNLTGTGNVLTVLVFDERGNLVKKLAENLYAAGSTSVTWDGTGDDGALEQRGIYLFNITLFDDRGKYRRWKKVCSLLRK